MKQKKILELEKVEPLPRILPKLDEFFDEYDEFGREPLKDGHTFWNKERKYIFDAKIGTYRVFYPRKSATEGIEYHNPEKIEKGLVGIRNILKLQKRKR